MMTSYSVTPASSATSSSTSTTMDDDDDDDDVSTSTATSKGHSHPSFTSVQHVAPTVGASSHTVKASAMGALCGLLGSVFVLF